MDLAGNNRVSGATIDIGAYEFQNPASTIYARLQQYGLPADGTADYSDVDGNHMNNWQEWTNPTDSSSFFQMLTPSGAISNLTLSWVSVTNRSYSLQRASSVLSPIAFQTIGSNIPGQLSVTTFTDTNAIKYNLHHPG